MSNLEKVVKYFNNLSLRKKMLLTYLFIYISFVAIIYKSAKYVLSNSYLYELYVAELLYGILFLGLCFCLLIIYVTVYFSRGPRNVINYLEKSYKEIFRREGIFYKEAGDEIDEILSKLELIKERTDLRISYLERLNNDFSNLYEKTPVMHCITSLNGLIIDVNPSFGRALKVSRQRILGKTFVEFIKDMQTRYYIESFFKKLSSESSIEELKELMREGQILDLGYNEISLSSFGCMDIISSDSSLFEASSYMATYAHKSNFNTNHFVRISLIDIKKLNKEVSSLIDLS